MVRAVYLIHLHGQIHHAKHYMGATNDLENRLSCHAAGKGSRLLEVAKAHGIKWVVVRLWLIPEKVSPFIVENRIKKQRNGMKFCPRCHFEPQSLHKLDDYPLELVNFSLSSEGFPNEIQS